MSDQEEIGLKPNCKLKQILEMPVASGNIYWLKQKSKGHVLIAKAGDLLNLKLINKFTDDHKFHVERVIKFDNFMDMKNKLAAYKNSNTERTRVQNLTNFLCDVRDLYFLEGKESSILSLSSACLETFKYEDSEFYSELYELSVPLFKRSIRFASLGAVYAMAIGYTDFKLVQDFYNICFYGVYGFLNENYTSKTLEFLEQERENPGTLAVRITEIKNAMEDKFKERFTYQFVENMKNFCFEKRDGTGLPNKINEDELNDLENIYILLSNTMTFQELEFKPADGTQYIGKMLKTNNAVKGQFRIKGMLVKRFDEIKPIEQSCAEMMV
jgi:hypothetical protein